MNSKERPLPNPSYIVSLSELEERAQSLDCALEIEFSITQGQNCDEGSFQEGGSFIATFTPLNSEIETLEEYEHLSESIALNNNFLNSWRVIKHNYNNDFTIITETS